jgi:hypothetical protein
MPKNLGEVTTATSENKKIAAVRISPETLLNLQSEALHAAAHVGVAGRDPDPASRWNGDQDRSAFNVAVINADGAFAPILTRASFISTRMTPGSDSFRGDGAGGADIGSVSSTITRANLEALAALRASRRHL